MAKIQWLVGWIGNSLTHNNNNNLFASFFLMVVKTKKESVYRNLFLMSSSGAPPAGYWSQSCVVWHSDMLPFAVFRLKKRSMHTLLSLCSWISLCFHMDGGAREQNREAINDNRHRIKTQHGKKCRGSSPKPRVWGSNAVGNLVKCIALLHRPRQVGWFTSADAALWR